MPTHQDAANKLQLNCNFLQEAENIDFWRSICPRLSISETIDEQSTEPYRVEIREVQKARAMIIEDGYFRVGKMIPTRDIGAIAEAVCALVESGFPAPFICVFDEFWQILIRLRALLLPILDDDYQITLDLWVYYISGVYEPTMDSKEKKGWPPHRDGGYTVASMRGDGRPKALTCWIPFTDVTPDSSCMYVLPTSRDPHFPYDLRNFSIPMQSVQDIRALPSEAGAVLGFADYALHWGSKGSTWSTGPRISAGVRFASADWGHWTPLKAITPFNLQARLAVVAQVLFVYREKYKYAKELETFCQLYTIIFNRLVSKDRS